MMPLCLRCCRVPRARARGVTGGWRCGVACCCCRWYTLPGTCGCRMHGMSGAWRGGRLHARVAGASACRRTRTIWRRCYLGGCSSSGRQTAMQRRRSGATCRRHHMCSHRSSSRRRWRSSRMLIDKCTFDTHTLKRNEQLAAPDTCLGSLLPRHAQRQPMRRRTGSRRRLCERQRRGGARCVLLRALLRALLWALVALLLLIAVLARKLQRGRLGRGRRRRRGRRVPVQQHALLAALPGGGRLLRGGGGARGVGRGSVWGAGRVRRRHAACAAGGRQQQRLVTQHGGARGAAPQAARPLSEGLAAADRSTRCAACGRLLRALRQLALLAPGCTGAPHRSGADGGWLGG